MTADSPSQRPVPTDAPERRDVAGRTSSHREAREGRKIRGISPEILRQVKLIELRTRGLVNSVFTGEYRSVFKGQGMEFSEVREYQVGDEVRSIDWNVTARMNRPFVKRYIEERELTVMLLVDMSASGAFGTVRRFKIELATELSAVLAMAAARNNDRVGAILFTTDIEHVVPPRKGRRHVLRVLRDILAHRPRATGTNLPLALDYLGRTLNHHSIVFIVSDFIADGIERPLKVLARRHDVVALVVEDPAEQLLPDVGLARFVDPETDETIDVDTGSPLVRAAFSARVAADRATRRSLFRRLAIDEVITGTGTGYMEPLLRFFHNRETRLRVRK